MTESGEVEAVLETEAIVVRAMTAKDLDAIVAIDAAASGRRRPRYFELMLRRSVEMAGLQVSLVAELDGRVAGFLVASLQYGEFGIVEPTAAIEAIGVAQEARRRSLARALMRQLRVNLAALGVVAIRTEVDWHDLELLGFFRSEGFVPAARICLERPIDPTRPEE